MKNNFINYCLFFFLFFTSCQFNNYETIDKNIRFRQQIKTGEFLKLSKDEHLVRLHIGLEDPKDLIEDLKKSLKLIK